MRCYSEERFYLDYLFAPGDTLKRIWSHTHLYAKALLGIGLVNFTHPKQ